MLPHASTALRERDACWCRGVVNKALPKMACHMSEVTFYQIEMIRGYNHMSFLENLEIMLVAGVEGKRIAFCLIDTQIVDESF